MQTLFPVLVNEEFIRPENMTIIRRLLPRHASGRPSGRSRRHRRRRTTTATATASISFRHACVPTGPQVHLLCGPLRRRLCHRPHTTVVIASSCAPEQHWSRLHRGDPHRFYVFSLSLSVYFRKRHLAKGSKGEMGLKVASPPQALMAKVANKTTMFKARTDFV